MLTHGPILPTPLNKKNPPKGFTALFAGNVTYMDHLVGRLVKMVDDLGLAEKTVIIFTGDNGSAVAGTLHGRPYPKGKGRRADWGVHVPFIVRAPGIIKKHGKQPRVSKDLVDFTDLFPTFAELAGAKLPRDLRLDGVSLVPSLTGEGDASKKRRWVYSQIGAFRMVRDRQFLLDNQNGFYKIADDPRQTKNLLQSTDKTIIGRRDRLKRILDGFPPNAKAPFKEFNTIPGKRKKKRAPFRRLHPPRERRAANGPRTPLSSPQSSKKKG